MRTDDWPAYESMMASERAKFLGGPYDSSGAWGMFCADHAQWDLYGAGALMIEVQETRQTVGQIGINSSPLFPETELGWLLYEGFEGQGYAVEAAQALHDWAFGKLGLATLVSYIDPQNYPSIAIAAKLGATLDQEAKALNPGGLVFRYGP